MNIDCDICAPEVHVDCTSRLYNGAAPMGKPGHGAGHWRCAKHRNKD